MGTRKGIIEIIVEFLLLIFLELCEQEVDNVCFAPLTPIPSTTHPHPPTLPLQLKAGGTLPLSGPCRFSGLSSAPG